MLGTGHLLCAVGQQSMVANLMPPGRFDSAFGYYTFAGSIGQAAGPGLLGPLRPRAALPRTDEAFLGRGGGGGGCWCWSPRWRGARPARPRRWRAERKVASLLRTPGLRAGPGGEQRRCSPRWTSPWSTCRPSAPRPVCRRGGQCAAHRPGGRHDGRPALHRRAHRLARPTAPAGGHHRSLGAGHRRRPAPGAAVAGLRRRGGDGLRPRGLPARDIGLAGRDRATRAAWPGDVVAPGGQPVRPGGGAQRHRPGRRRARRRRRALGHCRPPGRGRGGVAVGADGPAPRDGVLDTARSGSDNPHGCCRPGVPSSGGR